MSTSLRRLILFNIPIVNQYTHTHFQHDHFYFVLVCFVVVVAFFHFFTSFELVVCTNLWCITSYNNIYIYMIFNMHTLMPCALADEKRPSRPLHIHIWCSKYIQTARTRKVATTTFSIAVSVCFSSFFFCYSGSVCIGFEKRDSFYSYVQNCAPSSIDFVNDPNGVPNEYDTFRVRSPRTVFCFVISFLFFYFHFIFFFGLLVFFCILHFTTLILVRLTLVAFIVV